MTSISTTRIDAVEKALGAEVDAARLRADRRGWFTALYRQTTRAVRDQVAAGAFDDAGRMNRFVERFAARYMGPLHAFGAGAGEPVPRSWRVAFDAAGDRDTVIYQNLLLGINAHVNLDLAVVAAETSPGDEITSLHDDFMRVNAILSALMPNVRRCIDRFSPLFDVLDRIGGAEDDALLNFSIEVARKEAWSQALVLASTDDPVRRAELVESLDRGVAVLGKLVASPGGLLSLAVRLVAGVESDDVVAIIDALSVVSPDAA